MVSEQLNAFTDNWQNFAASFSEYKKKTLLCFDFADFGPVCSDGVDGHP